MDPKFYELMTDHISGRSIVPHVDLLDRMTVRYMSDDDGIWLECPDCSWWENLGFSPTVGRLFEAARRHWQERHHQEVPDG